jgi:hypothetical protein
MPDRPAVAKCNIENGYSPGENPIGLPGATARRSARKLKGINTSMTAVSPG